MARSAKFAKTPSKKEKAVRDTVKAASRPVRPPSPSPPPKDAGDAGGASKVKKRRMMRAKVDKVGATIDRQLGGANGQKFGKV